MITPQMSSSPHVKSNIWDAAHWPHLLSNKVGLYDLQCAQDAYAIQSFERAIAAQNSGAFAWEIVPVWHASLVNWKCTEFWQEKAPDHYYCPQSWWFSHMVRLRYQELEASLSSWLKKMMELTRYSFHLCQTLLWTKSDVAGRSRVYPYQQGSIIHCVLSLLTSFPSTSNCKTAICCWIYAEGLQGLGCRN